MADTPAWDTKPKYNELQLYNLAKGAGFKGDDAVKMAAISMAESGGNPQNINWSDPGGSYGLTQINQGAHGPQARAALDPTRSMKEAYALYQKRGGFEDWSTYKTGAYRKYLPPSGWKEPIQPKKPAWDTGASMTPKSSVPKWDLGALHDRPPLDRDMGAPLHDRPPNTGAPKIDKEMAKSIADQAGLTQWFKDQYKSGILRPTALSDVLDTVSTYGLSKGQDALRALGVPESLIRDATLYFTQVKPMESGLGVGKSFDPAKAAEGIQTPAIKPEGEPPIPGPNHPTIRETGVEGKPGFVTTGGEFVNRGEAAPIAEAAGQKIPGTGESLHSEDLKPGMSEAVPPNKTLMDMWYEANKEPAKEEPPKRTREEIRQDLRDRWRARHPLDPKGTRVDDASVNATFQLPKRQIGRETANENIPAPNLQYRIVNPTAHYGGKSKSAYDKIYNSKEEAFAAANKAGIKNPSLNEFSNGRMIRTVFPQSDVGPKSVSAATTPLSEIVQHNLKTFEEENAKTPGFKQSLRAAGNYFKSKLAPETMTDPLTGAKTGEKAAMIIRRNEGREQQVAKQAQAAMDKFTKFTNSLNLDEQLSLIKWMQSSTPPKGIHLTEEAGKFAEGFRAWMDTYKEKLRSLPNNEQMEFRENYVPQMWKQPDKAQAYLFGPGRTGSSGFTKKHVFDDFEEGIRAGFAPVTTNPMEIFSRYVENAAQFITSKQILADAKEEGLVVQRPLGAQPEPGWMQINDRSPPGTVLFAPEGFAHVFNAYRSTRAQGPYDIIGKAQWAANQASSVKLALSLYHATLETKVAWASGLADAITKGSKGDILGAAGQLGKTSFKPFTSYFAARKAWKAYLDQGAADPKTMRAIEMLRDANFDFMREGKLADEYRTSRLPGLIKSWERGRLMAEAKDAMSRVKGPKSALVEAWNTAERVKTTLMEPIFQYYVPWLKTQAAIDSAKTWIDAHPNATPEEFQRAGMEISDNIDARFGEMNRNNIFWSQTQKAIAQSTFLSYSYTYGIAKNALGAGTDLSKIPAKSIRRAKGQRLGQEDIWTDRLSFAIALPAVAVTTNAIYHYLKTGNAPQTEDLLHPKTGGTNEGQPERATLPGHEYSYINFFKHPMGDAFNKLNPLWQTMVDLGMNADYRNKQIWNPQDPVVKRIIDSSKFAAEQMGTPIAIEQFGSQKAGSNITTPETTLGIRPAGMADTNPGAFKQMMNYKNSEAAFESRLAKLNDELVRRGRPRLIFKHRDKQRLIGAMMQGQDPLAGYEKQMYGGTQ